MEAAHRLCYLEVVEADVEVDGPRCWALQADVEADGPRCWALLHWRWAEELVVHGAAQGALVAETPLESGRSS